MTDEPAPFSIDVGALRSRAKDATLTAVNEADQAGEQHGFVDRASKGRRGRLPSPRTGQVHAKVLPYVAEEIASEAKQRGVQQGVIIEELWAIRHMRKE